MIYINKTIHYCWFGRNPKPKLILKCIESWKRFCPDYDIKEWNEDNFDVMCCDYVREAFEAKKWAFVSDYCRFYVLYNYGGIYLDTDVELLKDLSSIKETFIGFETEKHCASGLIRGAKKGDPICKQMLDSYHSDHFILDDGIMNLFTVCERETAILVEHGLVLNNRLQTVAETTVYPSEFFNPTNKDTGKVTVTPNTISLHHYAASWVNRKDRLRGKIAKKLYSILGKEKADRVRQLLGRKK